MFQTKPIITSTIISKLSKLDNVPINEIIVVITCNQILKQHVFKHM
jgi:hypothetical protein